MPLRRTELPIRVQCPVDVDLPPDDRGRAWCTHCAKPVHVLSGLREHEVRSLLAAHTGRPLCVDYRARADGTIALRPDLARPWLASTLAGVVACAPPMSAASTPPDTAASQGCPLPQLNATPSEQARTEGEIVVTANFTIDPNEEAQRGMIISGVDDHHRPDRPDRLEWIPTKKLWKDFVARVRARRATAG